MKVPGLRSAYDEVGGIVYFGRMLDKIRLKAKGQLPTDYKTGTKLWLDFDARCTRFLKVPYDTLKSAHFKVGQTCKFCAGASSVAVGRAKKTLRSGILSCEARVERSQQRRFRARCRRRGRPIKKH